ncbi:MAG: DUF2497 domain-containing protein [Sphingomonadales bacterium]|nr:DUF2497 domain-containing protein [Sphingomonadales bacterium]MDE2567870.1 DUF2497 domain-containing protein [Sphingomonadales bacterium]
MRQASEPSVEEILESIKKVIARDNRAEAAQVRAQREGAGVVTTRGGNPAPRPVEVLELTEMELDGADPAEGVEETEEDAGDVPLVDDGAVASMRDSLAALAMLSQPGAAPQIVRSGETSLEGLVRDMLRPMLADWLDRNLPGMVEKMVAAEIARIAGKKG